MVVLPQADAAIHMLDCGQQGKSGIPPSRKWREEMSNSAFGSVAHFSLE